MGNIWWLIPVSIELVGTMVNGGENCVDKSVIPVEVKYSLRNPQKRMWLSEVTVL